MLYRLALRALAESRHEEAAGALARLLEAHPGHVNALVLLSKTCLALGDHPRSVEYARRVLDLDVRDDRVLALVADLLGRSEDHLGAKAAYEAAIRINPEGAAHLCNYASILRIEGRIDEAVEALERCIALDAAHCKAHWILSSLKRQTPADNHVSRLERLRSRQRLNDRGRMLIGFALSKEYEDIGEYERSFACLDEACRLKRRSFDYDVEEDTRPLRELEELFDSGYVGSQSGSGDADCAPVFIVGLPRTGSTLIEQILGATGHLFPGGELPTLGGETARLLRAHGGPARDFRALRGASIDWRALGRAYVEKSAAFIRSARHKTGFESCAAFIDKMPQNFMHVGFILLALPNAKVVVTERGAMDTCFGNFRQLYNDPFYRFSYRLDEMGAYYIAWRRLMRHWIDLFGDRIFTVGYERFVSEPEAVARAVFDYCGAPWAPGSLDPAGRSRPVATASATQVRQAINRESVDRWKRYARQLAPLSSQLRQAGVGV